MSSALRAARARGRQAFEDQLTEGANPYIKRDDPELWAEWLAGFREGRDEYMEAE